MRDYQRDTQQLPLEGHGAYFLLLQHCWTHGRIPAEDASRAGICKVSVQRWRKQLAPLVAGYFDANGENKRATAEIARAEKIRLRQAMAGHKGGLEAAKRKAAKKETIQATAKPRSSHGEAIKREDITTTFVGTAREAAPVDNSAAESAAPAAGSAGKQAKLAASPELLATPLARKYRT